MIKTILLSAAVFVTGAAMPAGAWWAPVVSYGGKTIYLETDSARQISTNIYSARVAVDDDRFSSVQIRSFFDCNDMSTRIDLDGQQWKTIEGMVRPACRIIRGY